MSFGSLFNFPKIFWMDDFRIDSRSVTDEGIKAAANEAWVVLLDKLMVFPDRAVD
jgi:hypothetical protein